MTVRKRRFPGLVRKSVLLAALSGCVSAISEIRTLISNMAAANPLWA